MTKDETLTHARNWRFLIPQTVGGKPFVEWLEQNYHVWESFCREANTVWNHGYKHYSARSIGQYLRHHTAMADNGKPWKLNDQCWPACARLWNYLHPEKPLFEIRSHKEVA